MFGFLGGKPKPPLRAKQIAKIIGTSSAVAGMTRRTISGADTMVGSDKGNIVEITSGTFTLAFTGAATLGAGWWSVIFNRSGGDITLDPSGAEQIDGLTTIVMRQGCALLVQCDGSAFHTVLLASPPRSTQYLTTGTGATYTTPAGVRKLVIKMIGGGGGGGAEATNNGGNGGTTTFNSINAAGGSGGVTGGSGGAGGTGGTGAADLRIPGTGGGAAIVTAGTAAGGHGGPGYMGMGGPKGVRGGTGPNAAANSGAGGTGGSGSSAGGGGGAGEYVEFSIANPAASYTYTIGTAGTGGAAGTTAGGNGGTGLIVVEEYY